MFDESESGEKENEPSQRKLESARKKGDFPRFVDLYSASVYFGSLISIFLFGEFMARNAAGGMIVFFDRSDSLLSGSFEDYPGSYIFEIAVYAVLNLTPLFLSPFMILVVLIIASRSISFHGSKIKIKISRVSIIANLKNKFGIKGIFEFFKSVTKVTVYSFMLFYFISIWSEDIVGLSKADPTEVVLFLFVLTLNFILFVLFAAIFFGCVDLFWQYASFLRRNRMSFKELRDEQKESEGDPFVKHQRRARAQEIAMNQMLNDVPNSDVIIVNPTHYAIALKWNRTSGKAPICVAKGCDELAATIRKIGEQAGVPIHSDPPTARALHATTRIGQEISTQLYQPVAAAIRFAEQMRSLKGKRFSNVY